MEGRFTGLTDTGLLRTVNQDAYHIDPEGRFLIVADGMGGHAGGEEASQIATQIIESYLNQYWDSDIKTTVLIKQAVAAANEAILADQVDHPERSDMGTTLVLVLYRKQEAWYTHIGDSRLYRLRRNLLEQMTEDQTWVAKAMKAGDITAEQARNHPWRHVLFQCLGRKDLAPLEIQDFNLQQGDRLLLCSDGLTEEVEDPAIQAYLQANSTLEEAAQNLVEEAKNNGGSDNITVVIAAFEEKSEADEAVEGNGEDEGEAQPRAIDS